jgi:hypothetical protein
MQHVPVSARAAASNIASTMTRCCCTNDPASLGCDERCDPTP